MIGKRLGPYEVTAKLGAGGMGEVWQAKDFQLGRNVALKVLPESFANDPERLQRFEREAKLLAQLNHPNIAQIYGFESSGETRALVMELVEGPTLAERLEQGPLPFNECLSISLQIAQALEEAHEKGIVHRDLKPQNIKASIEGKVKVLDFGLAKALDPAGGSTPSASALAQSPTLTLGATVQGVILGTAAYMSPEQAKGLAVDKRADIWAFGVVLYEMLTGARLFGGETVPETLAGVIRAEIDLGRLPDEVTPSIRRLLVRCLERNPKLRLRDIGEARIALERARDEPEGGARVEVGVAAPTRSRLVERVLFGVAALLLAALAWKLAPGARAKLDGRVSRLHFLPPEGTKFNSVDGPATLSPDGRSLVFRVNRLNGRDLIVVRRLDSFETKELPGTAGGYDAFWSPDSRQIGFFGTELSRVDANGLQPPQRVAPAADGRGGSWNQQGVVLFAPQPAGGLFRVSAEGGQPEPATTLDASRQELAHMRPQFLPDGKHFLYLIRSERPELSGIYVGELGGDLKKRVLAINTSARYSPPGALLSVQNDALVAQRFDAGRLEVVGEPVELARGVDYTAQYELSPISAVSGERLVFHPPSSAQLRQVERFDRRGERLASLGEPGAFNLDLSPDGTRLAGSRLDPGTRLPFLWIHDLARDVKSRVDTSASANGVVWSPDGRRIAYLLAGSTERRLVIRPAEGGAEQPVPLAVGSFLEEPIDWSPDGKTLLVEAGNAGERLNLYLIPVDGIGTPVAFATSRASEGSGRFSPDGKFIAYVSDQSGREEIYVEPLPQTGSRWLVSRSGGDAPRWSGDGREIFYVEPSARSDEATLMVVGATAKGAELQLGVAAPLFTIGSNDYEPYFGGREFLVGVPVSEAVARPAVMIENWWSLLGGDKP